MARERYFLNLKVFLFLFLIILVFTNSIMENILFSSKRLRVVTILGWFSNLPIIDYISCIRGRSRNRIFINSKIFYKTNKNSLNILANSPTSWIIFVPLTKVMLFLDFILLPKIGFSVFQNILQSVKLLMPIFSC